MLSRIILGSQSSSRRAMLLELGSKDMCIIPAKIDELVLGSEYRDFQNNSSDRFSKLVLTIATAKAQRIMEIIKDSIKDPSLHEKAMIDNFVYDQNGFCSKRKVNVPTSGIILTGDQIVTCNNEIFEKPKDAAQAKQFYLNYSNNCCSTVGSVILTDIATNCSVSAVDITTLHFNEIPESVIDCIVTNTPHNDENEVIMHCCGALMSEHSVLSTYIRQIDGDIDAVLGLRKTTVLDLLDQLAIKVAGVQNSS